jgi:hypothetical protein
MTHFTLPEKIYTAQELFFIIIMCQNVYIQTYRETISLNLNETF